MIYVILFMIIIFSIVFGPFLIIWALNTLFPVLAVAYSPETWCAVVLLGLFFNSTSLKFQKSKD
jgi:hypothetical protein